MRLQVVMINDQRRVDGMTYEGEMYPLEKRLVSIDLTPEQVEMLRPRVIGLGAYNQSLKVRPNRHEFRGDVWLEDGEVG